MKIYKDLEHPWAHYLSGAEIDTKFIFEHTKKKAIESTQSPIWILDIDSTLMCLSERGSVILQTYVSEHWKGEHKTELLEACKKMNASNHKFGIRPNLELAFDELGFKPENKFYDVFVDSFFPFWREKFFSGQFLKHDFAYPGAVDFCNNILALGSRIVYLTGRHEKTMISGTLSTMEEAGFPVSKSQAEFILKSDEHEQDLVFKEKKLRYLNESHFVLGFIDNEPENVLAQLKVDSGPMSVWFHSISSERIPSLSKVSNRPKVLDSFIE